MKAVTPWRPMKELESLQQRMDHLFDRLSERWFGGERPHNVWGSEEWAPAIESHIHDGNLVVKADLPGVDPKEVTVSVVGNRLTIDGQRKHEEKKEEKDYFYQELSYGKFSRSMTVPDGVDADKVKATFKNGVLEVTMPVPKQLTAKKIQIEAQK
jgi:HSP20 family protein